MFPGIIFHNLKKKNRKVLPYSMITLFVENFFVILKMILDRLDDIPLLNKRRPANLRNRSLINSTRFKNHLPNETPPMEMKKRRAHIAGDHASELFNPLPPSPLQKTTHPRRATRLDYACFTVHYNITLILHDKPLIFYKRSPPSHSGRSGT